MKNNIIILVLTLLLQTSLFGKERTMLIYCGITMLKPMKEIAKIIENKEGVKINFLIGGSGNLLNKIIKNKTGDMYLPGSEKYFSEIKNKKLGFINETVLVGHNRAVIFVAKGNPKNIKSDLKEFVKNGTRVVLGGPINGSIGKETKKIFIEKGIFEDVISNTYKLVVDSKGIMKEFIDKKCDISINWYAASTWAENRDYVDTISINSKYVQSKKLMIGLLSYSKYPNIARKFMRYASSKEGREIFKKYGLK